VYLINSTNDTIWFSTLDHRLPMIIQALNSSGEWTDIESKPSSNCGDSATKDKLLNGTTWRFVAPIYQGEYATKLRIKFEFIQSGTEKMKRSERTYVTSYSNVYNGTINKSQFWRKGSRPDLGLDAN
jgi:hypothetical protein